MYRIGIDVGGTFTDLVAVDDAGASPSPSPPRRPRIRPIGLIEGLALLAAELGIDLAALLAQTERIVHGTTVATNALLERKGAKVGTADHRGAPRRHRDARGAQGRPLQPAHAAARSRWCRARAGSACASGCASTAPWRRRSTRRSLAGRHRAGWRSAGVDAVAVCYLHSYRNAAPRAGDAGAPLARLLPGAYVSLSSEVLPQIKEYERVWTTVVNAYVGPGARDATWRASSARLQRARGYARRRADHAVARRRGAASRDSVRLAAGAVLSGPAGGIAGSRHARAPARRAATSSPSTWAGPAPTSRCSQDGEPQLTGDKAVGVEQGRAARASTSTRWARAAAPSRASTRAASCTSGRRARAPCPGPPATARAAPRRRSPTPTWCSGFLDPANFLGGRVAPRRGGGASARSTASRARSARAPSPAAEGISARRQHQHGGGHPHRLGPPRRRSAPLRAGGLRRRGGASRHGGRAPARDQPRRRAARGRRAVGVGHAGHRSPLRAGALARGRGAARSAAARLRKLFAEHGGRGPAAARRDFAGRVARARARSTCATASRSSRSPCRSTGWISTRADLMEQVVDALPPPPRGALHLQRARAGGRPRQRARGRDRRAARAARRAERGGGGARPRRRRAGASISATGWRCRSTTWTALPAGLEVKGPAIFESATTTVLIRARRAGARHAAGLARHPAGVAGPQENPPETTPHPALSPEGRGG